MSLRNDLSGMTTECAGTSVDDRLTQILFNSGGAVVDSPEAVLREHIPNSLALIQTFVAIEDEYRITLDYSGFHYEMTVANLVEEIRRAPSREHAGGIADGDRPDRDDGRAVIPLNPIQTAYALGSHDGIELGGQATFVYCEVRYSYPVDEVVAAANAVLARHEVDGYVLDLDSGVLYREVCDQRPIRPTLGGDGDRVRAQLMDQARASNETGPLIAGVVVEDADGARLLIYLNMIIADAGSVYVFLNEVDDMLDGRDLNPVMSIVEATQRVGSVHRARDRVRDLDYWREMSGRLPTRPDFGVTVAGTEQWEMTRRQFVVEHETLTRLESNALINKVSLSALLLAVNAAVVARWLNCSGLTVNVTVSERSALDARRPVIGDFTSSILVGVDVDGVTSVPQLSRSIGRSIDEGLAHRSIGGVEVMKSFLRGGGDQTAATAPIVFTSYVGGSGGERLRSRLDHVYSQTAQVCLDIQVMPRGDQLVISWDLVADYFPQAEAMFSRMMAAVAEVADGREILPLLDPVSELAISDYNNTRRPTTEHTVLSLVYESVRRFPGEVAVCLRSAGISYRYDELWRLSAEVAAELIRLGCRPGTNVIVEYTRHPDDVVNMLAVLQAGCVFVPVDAGLPANRRASIATTCDAFAEILTTGWRHNRCPEVVRADSIGGSQDNPIASHPDSLAYIIFTSGTTGHPKGVEITHRGCVNTLLDINERYAVTETDRIIGLSSLGFDLSIYDIFGTLAVGATLSMIADERDADEIIEVLAATEVTLWNSAPALLELLLLRVDDGVRFPSVRTVMLSGDRIAAGLPERAQMVFPAADIHSLGGATEGSIWSICYPLAADSLRHRIPYGYPMSNQGIHILGTDLSHCPIGVPGDIFISGLGVARGYCADPQRTAAAFLEIPGLGRAYRTGDVGVFNEERFVEFLGRSDRQVKIAGHRIELGEIESVLERSGLTESVIAVTASAAGETVLACLYVPVPGTDAHAEAVLAELEANLPRYMVPQRIVAVEEMPVTANGKLDGTAVQALVDATSTALPGRGMLAGRGAGADVAAADADTIERVEAIWDAVLAAPSLGRTESFFARGGDSLAFQRMLRRVQADFGIRLRFRDVIADPSIDRIASLLSTAGDHTAPEPAATTASPDSEIDDYGSDPGDPFPLTDMQMAYYIGRNSGFELGGVTEHYYAEFDSDVDIDRLEESLNLIIEHHPMLRAVFTEHATQRILAEVPRYRIAVDDLSRASIGDIENAIEAKRAELSHQVFDLEEWPLFSLSAIAAPHGRHRLFFSVDMIIGDGASQRIFLRDLELAYRGERLPDPDGDYRTYVLASRATSHARGTDPADLRAELDAIVDDFPAGNVLPKVCEAADLVAPTMRRLHTRLSREDTQRLSSAARNAEVSVSAVLLTLYACSLSLWSLDDAVGVNVTTYNRDSDVAPAEGVFGDFTGSVLLGFSELGTRNLKDLVQETQRRLIDHMEMGYSGVRLIGEISGRRGLWGQAVAPFVYTSLLFGRGDRAAEEVVSPSVLGDVVYAVSQTPQVLLDHQVLDTGGRLSIAWDFVEQVLDPVMMECVFAHFAATLDTIVADGTWTLAPVPVADVLRLKKQLGVGASATGDRPSAAIASGVLTVGDPEVIRQVCELAGRDLPTRIVDPDSNLFDLGLSSLRFVQLIQEVQRLAAIRIPLAQALNEPSPAAIARLVVEAGAGQADGPLTLLRAGSVELPVVMVHGGFGTIDIYRDLALALPNRYQVWGLDFRDFARVHPRCLSIEEIAASYVTTIDEALLGVDHIVLVGWSIGGTLAAEMARQIGSERASLVMLDSLAPGLHAEVGDFDVEAELRLVGPLVKSMTATADLPPASEASAGEVWEWVERSLDGIGDGQSAFVREIAARISPTLVEDLGIVGNGVSLTNFSTLRTLVAARNGYRPDGLLADSALFILPDDGEADNHADWADGLIGDLALVRVPGDHYSSVFGDRIAPTADAIAHYLATRRSRLDRTSADQAAGTVDLEAP